MTDTIHTGITGLGQHYAECGLYRIEQGAEGYICCWRRDITSPWRLFPTGEAMSEAILHSLLGTLGIMPRRAVSSENIGPSTEGPESESGMKCRYDVRAHVEEINGNGSDGAYDLIVDGASPREIADALHKTLSGDWGLTHSPGPFRIVLCITPQGTDR